MAHDADFRRELGQQLRVDSVRSSAAAGSGHPTSSMSAADLMAVLIDGHLRLDYTDPDNPGNDHLIRTTVAPMTVDTGPRTLGSRAAIVAALVLVLIGAPVAADDTSTPTTVESTTSTTTTTDPASTTDPTSGSTTTAQVLPRRFKLFDRCIGKNANSSQ